MLTAQDSAIWNGRIARDCFFHWFSGETLAGGRSVECRCLPQASQQRSLNEIALSQIGENQVNAREQVNRLMHRSAAVKGCGIFLWGCLENLLVFPCPLHILVSENGIGKSDSMSEIRFSLPSSLVKGLHLHEKCGISLPE